MADSQGKSFFEGDLAVSVPCSIVLHIQLKVAIRMIVDDEAIPSNIGWMSVVVGDHLTTSQIAMSSPKVDVSHQLNSAGGGKSSEGCNNPVSSVLDKTSNLSIFISTFSIENRVDVGHTSTMGVRCYYR